jgi:beta-carotene hydroxylase
MNASEAWVESARADRDGRRADGAWQQIRAERAIAAPSTGRIEPRIVFEALWSVGGFILAGVAGAAGWVPFWVSVPLASIFAFASYMPLHEATHNNVQGRHVKLRWLNDAVGHLSSIPLGFDFRGHQISHMMHHAHTNEIGKDPDLVFAGPYPRVVGRALMFLTVGQMTSLAAWLPRVRKRLLAELETAFGAEAAARLLSHGRRYQSITALAMLGLALAGYPLEVLLFWYLPSRIGGLITATVFAWLPHHPHNGHGRYTNTRVTLYPGSGLIGRGHDRHIIHHMIPRIPHYRIPEVFEKLRPILEERGTRIEGPGAGPGAPNIVLGWDDEQVAALAREAALADAQPFS